MNKRIFINLAFVSVAALALVACKKDIPKKKTSVNHCQQVGTVAHLPMFCGTPPVVYQIGIKDTNNTFYRVNNDRTGLFETFDLGDTIGFTITGLTKKDPINLRSGDLVCASKLASAPLSMKGNLLTLKVDHETYNFEGGHERTFFRTNTATTPDTLPYVMYYNPPGDFGSVELFYGPTHETFFEGTIIWMGLGKISTPKVFKPAGTYSKTSAAIPTPAKKDVQIITYPRSPKPEHDIQKIWSGINDLQIVKDYLDAGATVAIYKYTPSVGIGDPNDWDYMVFLHYRGMK